MCNQGYSGIGTVVSTSAKDTWTTLTQYVKTAGTQTTITPYLFFLGGTSGNNCYVDSVSMTQMGEIVRYQFNDNLNDTTSNAQNLTGSGTPTYVTNTLIYPLNYGCFNPHVGTLSTWITPEWNGTDNKEHRFFTMYYNSTNYFLIYKSTANTLIFNVTYGGITSSATYSISTWTKETKYHVVCLWSETGINGGANYLQIYVNGASVATSTTSLGQLDGVEEHMDYGHYNGSLKADAKMESFQIDSVNWRDTKANAIAVGMPQEQSIEWHYNSGTEQTYTVMPDSGFLVIEEE
jgi:hypothetical protein